MATIKKQTVVNNASASTSLQNQPTRKRRTSALSLKKVHNKLTDIDYVASDEDNNNKPKDKFLETDLVEKWTFFGNDLKQKGELNIASIVNANKPVLKNEEVIFALPNSLMEEQFGSVKSKLLNYLRTELNNYSIKIKTVVVASEKKKYIYTPQEKFRKLVETNPNVMLLKNKFGLNI